MRPGNGELAIVRKESTAAEDSATPVWIRIPTAAALLDLTPNALKQRLYRQAPPAGVVRRWGRTVLIHRERFLRWIEEDPHA
jgi:hypothetical protein